MLVTTPTATWIENQLFDFCCLRRPGAARYLIVRMNNRNIHETLEFVIWVIAANIFALPLAFFAMNKWLQNFAYRVNIGLPIFFISGILALLIALITVSYRSIKVARANPVDSLRYE